MAEAHDLEEQLRTLTKRFEDLRGHVIKPPKPHWTKRILTWDMLRNVMVIVGIPVALLGAWNVVDQQFLRYEEIERSTRLPAALEQLDELQSYNAEVYTLQAKQEHDTAFALIEAKRGRVERLIKGILAFWTDYPDEFTVYEKTALAEGLITHELTAEALAVLGSIDQSGMSDIQQGDLDLLQARILFARGSGQDPESARDALRAAMAHAEAIEDKGVGLALMEKYAGVRLVNELWLGTDCADVAVFAGFLGDMVYDGTTPANADAVRRNTYDVMAAHDRLCGAT